MSERKLYISGKMTGLPEFGFPAFHAAEAKLRRAGFATVNPASLKLPCGCLGPTQCRPTPHHYTEYLRMCLQALVNDTDLNGIALLPNWTDSKGAKTEVTMGRALGLEVQPVGHWLGEAHLLSLSAGQLMVAPRDPHLAPVPPPPVRICNPMK